MIECVFDKILAFMRYDAGIGCGLVITLSRSLVGKVRECDIDFLRCSFRLFPRQPHVGEMPSPKIGSSPRLFRTFHQARNRPPRLRAFRRRYIPQSPPATHLVLSYMQYVTPLTATNAQAASIVKHMHLKQRDFGKNAPANSKRYPIYARVTHNPKSCGSPLP